MMDAMRWGRAAVLGIVLTSVALVAAGCGSGEKEFKPTTASFKSGASSSVTGLTLESSAFKDNDFIPERYSCKGSNTPPPLNWGGTPLSAKDVAIIVTDPDAPNGTFVHWIVTGLPLTAGGSITGSKLPAGAKVEKNSADQAGYTGMCPPAGATHTYTFEVLALRSPAKFDEGMSPIDKVKALRADATHGGRMRGRFKG